jgi:hypothetical protein
MYLIAYASYLPFNLIPFKTFVKDFGDVALPLGFDVHRSVSVMGGYYKLLQTLKLSYRSLSD